MPGLPQRALAVLTLAVTSLVLVAPGAGAESAEERRLQEAQSRIDQVRAEVDRTAAQQRQDLEAVSTAEAQLIRVIEAVNSAELATERQRQAVDDALERLAEAESRERAELRVLGERAAALYKQGSSTPFVALLAADSPGEALRRSAYAEVVHQADRESVEQVAIARQAVNGERSRLMDEQRTLERVLQQQRALLVDAERLRNDSALALAASSQRLAALQAEEAHLSEESRELGAIARRSRRFGGSRAGGGSVGPQPIDLPLLPGQGGAWTWPAIGQLSSGYGLRWGRMHEGIDIAAPSGTPILAARGGVVSYAGQMSGYGNLVLVDHGAGLTTAYAHQSRIHVSVGQLVSAGQQLGEVGSTGISTGSHLHFEVRVNGSPRNPREYVG